MRNKFTKEDYILLIRQKADELGRIPKKSDFDNETAGMIKSFFGPWPRAMEAAGVKEANLKRAEKKLERRRRSKKRKATQAKYSKEQ